MKPSDLGPWVASKTQMKYCNASRVGQNQFFGLFQESWGIWRERVSYSSSGELGGLEGEGQLQESWGSGGRGSQLQ